MWGSSADYDLKIITMSFNEMLHTCTELARVVISRNGHQLLIKINAKFQDNILDTTVVHTVQGGAETNVLWGMQKMETLIMVVFTKFDWNFMNRIEA
jgi:hypothetical protein